MPVDEEESIVDAVLKVQLDANGVDDVPQVNGNSHHPPEEDQDAAKEQPKQQQQVGFCHFFTQPFDPGQHSIRSPAVTYAKIF